MGLKQINNNFVQEARIRQTIEDAGFEATILREESSSSFSDGPAIQVCRIGIKGMTCTSCSSTIESALNTLRGVRIAQVALATEEAEIHYDPKTLTHNQIIEAVEETGFEASLISLGEDVTKIDIQVEGFKTDESLRSIADSLRSIPGIVEIETFPEIKKISIAYKADLTGPRTFIEAVESSGSGHFKAVIYPEDQGARDKARRREIGRYKKWFLWSLIFTIPVFLTSMVFMYIPWIKKILDIKVVNMLTVGEILRWELATPVQFVVGRRFYVGSYKALRNRSPNMDVLIALGTNAAYFYSVYIVLRAANSKDFEGTDFFETSSMLITFILLGKYLEVLAKGKTSEAIAKLMNLAPETAVLLSFDRDGNVSGEEEIDSRLIQKNDVIKVYIF